MSYVKLRCPPDRSECTGDPKGSVPTLPEGASPGDSSLGNLDYELLTAICYCHGAMRHELTDRMDEQPPRVGSNLY